MRALKENNLKKISGTFQKCAVAPVVSLQTLSNLTVSLVVPVVVLLVLVGRV